MQKITRKLFILYLLLFLLLNSALALYEGPEINDESDTNPIPELYLPVAPAYMDEVIGNISFFLDSFVYYDILQNPPSLYDDIKVNITEELEKINTNELRPFYEYYRDLKMALSKFHDANFDILGDKLPHHLGNINFFDYRFCLPFKFYLDYEENQEVYMYIKEYLKCSQYYNQSLIDNITALANVPLLEINGQNAFDFIQEFGREFYKFKNPDSDFSINIDIINDDKLVFIPLSIEELNRMDLLFNNGVSLNTKFHIIKEAEEPQEEINEEKNEANITWDESTENGEFKCRVDNENQLNVLFIKSFFYERGLPSTIYRCSRLIYSNDYKIVIITSQLWDAENTRSFLYLQLLFPKMNGKYNMAMKQTNENKYLFDKDSSTFLDPKTCRPYNSWDEFIEPEPDVYSEGVEHHRTKIFNPIKIEYLDEMNDIRRELIGLGHLKKSTDIVILTDTVNYGPASTFIKTIQNNGGAIIASYAGNPKLDKSNITTLDASLDPAINTDEYDSGLDNLGFAIYEIPYAEAFENIEVSKGEIPLAFKVNKVDEITNIYHYYDDAYYEEFINGAKKIFTKYNDNGECNKDNMNLVYESNSCSFNGDSFAHGGYKCGNDGKWSAECKKTYCDFGYFYNKLTGKCEKDICTADEIMDINEETEMTLEIDPLRRYIINLNTNLYTYFFKSDVDDIIFHSDLKKCSKFCGVKNRVDFMYLNYGRNLTSKVRVTIISKKLNLYIESFKLESPQYSLVTFVNGKEIYIFQITEPNDLYFDSFDKSARFYLAKYDDNMTPDDIVNKNDKYFKEIKDQFLQLAKGGIYIAYFEQEIGFLKFYFYNSLPEYITITYQEPSILFLSKDVEKYQINFAGNNLPLAIRLNEKTNTTFIISDNITEKSISLNDKYFIPSTQPFNGTIEIYNIKGTQDEYGREGALIDLLYSFGENETEIINETVTNYVISKLVTLVEFNPPEGKNNIQIFIESKDIFYFSSYGGLSKDNYIYTSLFSEDLNNYKIKLDDPLKGLDHEQDEKYYISLFVLKPEKDQEIKLTVKYINNPIEDLYEKMDESYAKDVISNLASLTEDYYVFADIIKNPPQPEGLPQNYTHSPINLTKALNAIETKDKNFYDFYREIRAILGTPRDLHFRIYGLSTPSGVKFDKMFACLPFSFYVDKDENNETKVFIKYFSDCGIYFSEEIRDHVKELEKNKTAVELINKEDPIDYIQNWGRIYKGLKSPHGHFSYSKNTIHAFAINLYPYKPEELKMEFKFEGVEKSLNLDYYIYIPNLNQMNLLGSNALSQKEFDEFYENEMKKHIQDVNEPNIFEMVKKYKKTKGLFFEEKKEYAVEWDYQTPEENGIKCRVDEINHLNVILQETFLMDINSAVDVIYKCAEKFFKNDYKVVVIENKNGGGYALLSVYLHQLLQVKIQNRGPYIAYKSSDVVKEDYSQRPQEFINIDTCKPYTDADDFLNGTIDDYSTDTETILHKKTKFTEFFTKEDKIRINKMREELKKLGHTKKPTDIIIFTDSFSYSATSLFIKAFQNEGGAIIVGYNGNPKLGKEVFDASQSPTSVIDFGITQEYANLKKLGILVGGISYAETFDEDYKNPDPIPREYKVDIIDERSDILDAYSDDKYDIFMEEAKNIFKKYNDDNQCNPNNTNLLFEPEGGCGIFEGDEHAHGGYPCGSEGEWNKSACQKFYCDSGYYYSKIEDKCIQDFCTNDPQDEEIILNGPKEETIIINKQNNIEYTLRLNTNEYTYFFEASEPGFMHYEINNPCPSSICVLQMNRPNHENKIHLNFFRNPGDKEITIKITSIPNFPGAIQSLVASSLEVLSIQPLPPKLILITESVEEYNYYLKTFDASSKIYCAEYNKEMKVDDIVNINENYFKEIKNQLIEAPKGKTYILAAYTTNPGAYIEIFIQPKIGEENIIIPNNEGPLFLYFNKGTKYLVDFTQNNYNRMIQLSKATLDREISITDLSTQKETLLSSTNSYYAFGNQSSIFKGRLTIEVKKGDSALIEFLFAPRDFEILDQELFTNHKIAKSAIIKFDKNNKDLNMKIKISSASLNLFGYSFFTFCSKNNYIPYPLELNPSITGANNYELEIYNPDVKLEEGESFSLLININKNVLATEGILITKKVDERYPLLELYQEVTPEYMNDVIQKILTLLDLYVFSDIMKNPPNPYNEFKVDIKSKIKEIKRDTKRPFYEFYRDIKMALSFSKDTNLDFLGAVIPLSKGTINFADYRMCLPFFFYLDNKDNQEVKMYIQEYEDCSKYFDKETKDKIKALENKSLKEINGTDPFDYVNNFSTEFYSFKNRNSQFSISLDSIPENNLIYQPLTPWQLNYIKLTFDNDDVFETHFQVIKSKEEDDPSNKKEEIKEGEITWKYQTKGGELKCRVDTTNNLNVLYFNGFYLEEENEQRISTIENCTELFYSNDYKIVIITSQLWTGQEIISYIYTQLLFPKIDIKLNLAMKQTELNRQIFQSAQSQFLDAQTCRPFNSWEDFIETEPDDYGERVFHNRTKVFNIIPEQLILELDGIRRKYINLGHAKKSTDIIILTDTVNYGSASLFIKTIQSNGAAIIASYGGNPKLDKSTIEALDASLDPAFSIKNSNLEIIKSLKEKGFDVLLPLCEAFENANTTKNEIPMAFKVNKVDEMTNIYHFYYDDYYDEFINEAKKIFTKYNDDKKCNKDNMNLVYENDQCTFEDDNEAHGGFKCVEGQWGNDNSTCKKSYCNIGYYYDKTQDKCVNDYCTNNPEVEEIVLNDTYDETITINQENNTIYILRLKTSEYVYFFEASEPGFMHYEIDNPCPSSICVLQQNVGYHNNKLYLNYYKNVTDKDITIKITSKKNFPGLIQSLVVNGLSNQGILSLPEKVIIISESLEDYIYYFKALDNATKLYCGEYNKEMKIDDIINVNGNYFNKLEQDQLIESQTGKTYIIAAVTEKNGTFLELYVQPKIGEKDMSISEGLRPLLLYFSKDIEEYTLDFANNKYDRMIQLSKSTLDSEIILKGLPGGKEVTLNSNNIYYIFADQNSIFKGKLSIKVNKGENALIEFLFAPTNFEIMNEKEYKGQKISKSPIIKFDKNTKNKNINITISTKSGNNFGYSYLTYYSKNDYMSYPEVIEPTFTGANSYTLTINNKEENLEKDETFSLVIYIQKEVFEKEEILITKVEEKSSSDEPEKEDDGELEGWAIALIVVGSVIVLIIIFIIVWKCVLSKEHVDSEIIGSLVEKSKANEMGETRE